MIIEGTEKNLNTLLRCFTLIILVFTALGFHECYVRGRERHQLRKIHVEKCLSTPAEAEKLYPNPS